MNLTDPGHPLSAFTTELTGITDNHVKGAKPLLDLLGVSRILSRNCASGS